MSLFKWCDKAIKKFKWFDISLIKLATFVFALLVAKYFPALLDFDWQLYALIIIIASIRPLKIMFSTKR